MPGLRIAITFAVLAIIAAVAIWGPQKHRRRFEYIVVGALMGMAGVTAHGLLSGTDRIEVFICGIFLAILLFFWRIRFRSIYGLAEFAFALYVLWDASGEGRGAFSPGFSAEFSRFEINIVVIQMLGAVYVLIRGMDNFFQGLPEPKRKAFESRVKGWRISNGS